MISIILVSCGIVLCLYLSAFFSSSEMAYSSCNEIRIENMADEGNKRAIRALRIVNNYDATLSSILIGNNLVNVASTSLASVLVILVTGSDGYAWVSTVLITLLVIIFGETIPKIKAKQNANLLALKYSGAIRTISVVLKPLIFVVNIPLKLITNNIRIENNVSDDASLELSSIIETAEDEDAIDEDQSELAHAAIDFYELSAIDAMTARVDMKALDINSEDVVSQLDSVSHSRIPVYRNSIDNIIGVLYVNHYLKALLDVREPDVNDYILPACFVYKTTKLPVILEKMKKEKQQLAVVFDEYGGTLGLITMEDLLEQIVGEIWDETDVVAPEIVKKDDGSYELDGDMLIDDFIDLLGEADTVPETESRTVGGWITEITDGTAKVGDTVDYFNIHLTVMKIDGLRVEKILLKF